MRKKAGLENKALRRQLDVEDATNKALRLALHKVKKTSNTVNSSRSRSSRGHLSKFSNVVEESFNIMSEEDFTNDANNEQDRCGNTSVGQEECAVNREEDDSEETRKAVNLRGDTEQQEPGSEDEASANSDESDDEANSTHDSECGDGDDLGLDLDTS
jgi:hypothetical protein